MEVKVLGDTVVCSHEMAPVTGLIHIEKTGVHNQATVLAVGPGRVLKNGRRYPMTVKVGDRILLPRFGGLLYEHEGKPVRYIQEPEIIAVLSEDNG